MQILVDSQCFLEDCLFFCEEFCERWTAPPAGRRRNSHDASGHVTAGARSQVGVGSTVRCPSVGLCGPLSGGSRFYRPLTVCRTMWPALRWEKVVLPVCRTLPASQTLRLSDSVRPSTRLAVCPSARLSDSVRPSARLPACPSARLLVSTRLTPV